jgi:hypothetical protein
MLWCRLDDLVARNVGCSLCHACGMPLSSNGCRTATKFLLLLSATLRGICNKSRSVSLRRAERNLRECTCNCLIVIRWDVRLCLHAPPRARLCACCAGACWDARLKAHFIHLKGHSDPRHHQTYDAWLRWYAHGHTPRRRRRRPGSAIAPAWFSTGMWHSPPGSPLL